MWHTPSYSKIKQLGADSLWQAAKPHTLVVNSLLQVATPQTIARDGLWPSIILLLSFFTSRAAAESNSTVGSPPSW